MTALSCSVCGGAIGAKNRSGRCRPCTARFITSQPGWRERQRAGLRKKFDDPVYAAAHNARLARAVANMTPEQIEARREHGRRIVSQLTGADSPAARAKAGRSRTETVLSWCPPEWRDKYRELTRKGRRAPEAKQIVLDMIAGAPEPAKWAQQNAQLAWCPARYRQDYLTLRRKTNAAEARAMIEDMISAEARRPKRTTPLSFDEKLARVANGAGLINVRPLRKPEPAFTLGGISSGAL